MGVDGSFRVDDWHSLSPCGTSSLMIPGPTTVPETVLKAMGRHRSVTAAVNSRPWWSAPPRNCAGCTRPAAACG